MDSHPLQERGDLRKTFFRRSAIVTESFYGTDTVLFAIENMLHLLTKTHPDAMLLQEMKSRRTDHIGIYLFHLP